MEMLKDGDASGWVMNEYRSMQTDLWMNEAEVSIGREIKLFYKEFINH